MRRFASIDFLRGLAILLMIILHTIGDVLYIDTLVADINNLSLLEIVLLIVLPFLGGLAGFFLMISAIGNTISMQKQLQRGRTSKEVAVRQIMGGILLLIFAMLVEAILGYHGFIGEIFQHLNDPSQINTSVMLWRGYHFETIHTIAWCVIINGLVHAFLTKDEKWKETSQLIKKYLILTAIIIVLTPLMWWLSSVIVPGYPYAIDPLTNKEVQYAVIGVSSPLDFILRFLVSPLAAMWEPVFPYLAVSFIGSAIGIYLSQERKEIDPTRMKKFLKLGVIMFFIGLLGVVANLVIVLVEQNIDEMLNVYLLISEHRYWTVENGVPLLGWLFQFLLLNGFGLCAIIMIIWLVEFRGKGKEFAEKTVFIRRLGFVAFTIYSIQFVYYGMHFIVSSLLGTPYERLGWGPTLLVLALSLLVFYLITWAWEKNGYIGSLEWMIGTIASYAIPGKKTEKEQKWWQRGRLDVDGAFYNAEWLNVIEDDEINHNAQSESKLSYKIARLGFLFFPFSFVAYGAAKKAADTEEENKFQKKGKTLGLIGIIFILVMITVFSLLTLSMIGLSL